MADLVTIKDASNANVPILTDEVTDGTLGVGQAQYLKIIDGTINGTNKAAVDSSGRITTAPQPANVVSTANSSTSVLGAGAAFTGTSEDISNYAQVFVNVFASHASATDGLSLQQSSNGTNWDIVDTFTIVATIGRILSLNPGAQFFRVVYTNGGTLQTSFRLQTIFKRFYSLPRSQRSSDAFSNENDLDMTQAFAMVWNGTTWDRQPGTTAGATVKQAVSGTATLANVASSASNVTLRAANTSRLGLNMYNDSTSSCYVKFGATASATSFTVFMGPGAYWEMPIPIYTGIVDGIWVAANGNMRVTELS